MFESDANKYGEFRISRPTSINVSNPAFEIKRCVLYFVLSDFAPPKKKPVCFIWFCAEGGGIKRMTF